MAIAAGAVALSYFVLFHTPISSEVPCSPSGLCQGSGRLRLADGSRIEVDGEVQVRDDSQRITVDLHRGEVMLRAARARSPSPMVKADGLEIEAVDARPHRAAFWVRRKDDWVGVDVLEGKVTIRQPGAASQPLVLQGPQRWSSR